jgi:hypothetical protein
MVHKINSYYYVLLILPPLFRQLQPPSSPDLNPRDYDLQGTIQDRVYANNTNYLQEMKDNIQMTITNISRLVLHHLSTNIVNRCTVCLETGGQQSETPLCNEVR